MRVFESPLLIVILIVAVSVPAQALPDMVQWPEPGQGFVGVRLLHPGYDRDYGYDIASGLFDIYAGWPVSAEWSLLADLPYMRFDGDYSAVSATGNLFVGGRHVRFLDRGKRTIVMGLALPTSTGDDGMTLLQAFMTNFHEVYKYIPDATTLYIGGGFERYTTGGFTYGLELASMFIIVDSDSDFYLRYAGFGGWHGRSFELRAGLMGLCLATEEFDDFQDKFWNSVFVRAGTTTGPVRPSVFLRIPLKDDIQNYLNTEVGIQVDLCFGG